MHVRLLLRQSSKGSTISLGWPNVYEREGRNRKYGYSIGFEAEGEGGVGKGGELDDLHRVEREHRHADGHQEKSKCPSEDDRRSATILSYIIEAIEAYKHAQAQRSSA